MRYRNPASRAQQMLPMTEESRGPSTKARLPVVLSAFLRFCLSIGMVSQKVDNGFS